MLTMNDKCQIVAIGGGGFGRAMGNMKIEKYILSLSKSSKPRICFIPTASGDNDLYKLSFYRVFSRLNCFPSHIDFFKRTIDLEKCILDQDIVYVGGGNTRSMLAIWREWGLDEILKKAYQKGVIMSGVSAGAICWFEKGITDSKADGLSLMSCLNFVNANCCPHFDEEPERIPYVEKIINNNIIDSCIGIEGDCALHLINEKPYKSIDFGEKKNSYLIKVFENDLVKIAFDKLVL